MSTASDSRLLPRASLEELNMRIVHYLNQFFGGIGAEEQAGSALEFRDGTVGEIDLAAVRAIAVGSVPWLTANPSRF